MNDKERLQEIFRDIFDDGELIITDSTSADDIEDWDSLAQINLVVAIEKEFGVRFNFAQISQMKDVGEILNQILLVKKK
jgi:acyl carrier protein